MGALWFFKQESPAVKYLRGYKLEDIPLIELPPIKDVKFRHKGRSRQEYTTRARAVGRCLPWYVSNGVHPKPDHRDVESILLGAIKRFGFDPPTVSEEDRELYRKFCRETYIKEFVPLQPGQFMDFEQWLDRFDASGARKQQLRDAYEEFCVIYGRKVCPDVMKIGSFIKDEAYPVEKPLRWINARDDLAKTFLGPAFQVIGDQLGQHPWSIKKVPVKDRARHLTELFSGNGIQVEATDYVSFEAHFVEWLMRIEIEFYEYMLAEWEDFRTFVTFCGYLSGATGVNMCYMRGFGYLMLVATRMSGEMNTSLGNTFHNMMMIRFLAHLKGAEVRGIV